MKKRNAFFSVIVLSFFLLSVASLYAENTSDTLHICTFNIHYDKENDTLRSWQSRRSMVMQVISDYNFDLVGCQEVKQSQLADLKAWGIYGTIGEGIGGKTSGVQNTILFKLSRFDLLDSGVFWLSETPEVPSRSWDAKFNRNCSWARLKDKQTGKEFFFFNSHFDHQGVESRISAAYLVYAKIKEIAGSSPSFFMGDLNSTPESEPIQVLDRKMANARENALVPPLGPYGTGHGFRINKNTRRIDYIFVSKQNVAVTEYETVDRLFEGKAPSDHWPVRIKALLK